jgi:flagellar protein FliS
MARGAQEKPVDAVTFSISKDSGITMASLNYQHPALRQYQSTGIVSEVSCASPHRLVEMLLAGAISRIARARGAIMRNDFTLKIESILSAAAIIEHLRMILDMKAGGEVARNLAALYDYMLRRLIHANADNDAAALEEVAKLLREVKLAWDAIPLSVRASH